MLNKNLEITILNEHCSNLLDNNFGVDVLNNILTNNNEYNDSLGWFDIDKWANIQYLNSFKNIANKIREKADCFVVIGVGGSNQAARAIIEALKDKISGPDILWVGNNLSGNYISNILSKLDNYNDIYINVIAKNFETLEPGLSFRLIRQYLQNRYDDYQERIIVTGTINSHLYDLSIKHNFTFVEFPKDIGGRYSSLSAVGLLPMAVAGIDIDNVIKGGKDISKLLKEDNSNENLALIYARNRKILYDQGYYLETLSYFEPRLYRFSKWWIQLFGESEGKDNKGIYPISANYSEDLHSIGQFMQEGSKIIFETFIDIDNVDDGPIIKSDIVDDKFEYLNNKTVNQINKEAFKATINAHSKVMPCIKIKIDRLDEYYFGQLFYYFEFACYLYCRLNDVNPFDQNGVEEYKKMMFEYLGK